jgi:indolepyruvate ferredoxin oxidoreductase beta subunit
MTPYNTLVTGVGGQGVLFISEILGMAALKEGLDVRVAEIHGMAQRGGSVTCNVRIGKRVYSPTITKGTADLIIGLEPLEVLRLLGYAHDETIIALNMNPIVPSSTTLSGVPYPPVNDMLKEISRVSKKNVTVNTLDIALKVGNPATQNAAMLGFVSALKTLPVKHETLRTTIGERSPSKYRDVNLKAFDLGSSELRKMWKEAEV